MNEDVHLAQADWPVERLAEFLVDHDISGAPVVDEDERLVGVVSLTDIARHSSTQGSAPAPARVATGDEGEPYDEEAPHDYFRSELEDFYSPEDLSSFQVAEGTSLTVADIMTPEVYDVNEYTSLQQVASVMLRGRIHRVFVTDDDHVRGVITALDMLKVVQDM